MNQKPKENNGTIWKLGLIMLTNDANFGLGVYVIYLVQLGLSLAQVSMVVSFWLLFSSIGQIPSGIFADKYGYKAALVTGSLLFCVGTFIFATSSSFILLCIGYSITGFGSSMKQGADYALLYEHLLSIGRKKEYKKIAGKLDFYTIILSVIAGILGGIIYTYSIRAPFYAEVIVALLGLITCLTLVEPTRVLSKQSFIQQIKGSFSTAFKTPRFSKIFLFSAIIGSVSMMTFQFVQPLYKSIGIPESMFGIIAATLFLFKAGGSFFADKLGSVFSVDKYLVLHASVFGLFLVVLQRMTEIYFILPVLAVFFFLRGLYSPTVSTYINDKMTSDKRATMLSINQQLRTAIGAISVSGLGIVAERYGLQQVFFVISIISMLSLIAYVLTLRSVKMD